MAEEKTDLTRCADAIELLTLARARVTQAGQSSDPVYRRKWMVKAAKAVRQAADQLDDYGRLTEEY